MIRLGVRLSLRSGGESLMRLLATAAGVAIGVTVLLAVVADFHAFQTTVQRPCWECTLGTEVTPGTVESGDGAELWRLSTDYFADRQVERLDVAALGSHPPLIPGLSQLPAAGEFTVSPALSDLLAHTAHDQLGDRFPGRQTGVLGDDALSAPDELVIVIGHTPRELAAMTGVQRVTAVRTQADTFGTTTMYQFGFGLAAIALTLPIMVLVATATRLAAARREERFAAMRLVGTTNRQISVIASIDAALGAVLGTAVGVGLFLLVEPWLATVSITGAPFLPRYVTPTGWGYLAVVIGVPVASVVAALWSLRRVRVSPLGVTRKVTPRPPRAWRILPLPVGAALFIGGLAAGGDNPSEALIYPSLIVIMLGLVIAGPWLTMVAARLLAAVSGSASALLAARRLGGDPKGAFRTVSGLVLTVFLGTAIAVLMPSLLTQPNTGGDPALRDVLRVGYGLAGPGLSAQDGATVVDTISGYAGTTVIPMYRLPDDQLPEMGPGKEPPDPRKIYDSVVDCTALARLPVLGRCAAGQQQVKVMSGGLFVDNPSAVRLPAVDATNPGFTGDVRTLRLGTLLVAAPDAATLERVRTFLTVHAPWSTPLGMTPAQMVGNAWLPATFGEISDLRAGAYDALERIAYGAVGLTLLIAACSLAVSSGAGMVERRRPFTLLRLTGTPMSGLTRVVLLESLLPLVSAAILAAATGYVLAAVVVDTLGKKSGIPLPGGAYFLATGGGLVLSLAVICSTLPLLRMLIRTDTARFE
ncbi:ABC transporter permease [Hamadaea tsunoensis]|uniref:ABC transporter permease n=1 Tax=Hamadaea tsunoensis TaxID=53368 RepID=UPI000419D726|nr:ABC transporter permease [Hamadaea tsunoensis]